MLPTPGVGFWFRGRRDEKGPTFLSVRLDLGDLRAELRTCRGRTCRVDSRSELLELGAENDKKCSGQRLADQLLSPNTRSLTVASRQGTLAKPRRQRCALCTLTLQHCVRVSEKGVIGLDVLSVW